MSTGLPTFTVRNLGPIAHGTVQLRPLTILIGQDNSGKTYMAQAVYAAFKALQRVNGSLDPPLTPPEAFRLVSLLRHPSTAPDADVLAPITPKLQNWMHDRLDRAGELLNRRLSVYFDVDDIGELARWNATEPLEISVGTQAWTDDLIPLFGLNSEPSATPIPPSRIDIDSIRAAYEEDLHEDYLPDTDDFDDPSEEDLYAHRTSGFLANYFWRHQILGPAGLAGTVHYLPAGRSGLLESWTDVVRMRLELEREGLFLDGRDPAALGGIALDFLLQLQSLTRPRGLRRGRRWRLSSKFDPDNPLPFRDAVAHLETLIDGAIVVARGRGRVPSLGYKRRGNVIPVQRASSMVAELAPLLSWIDNFLNEGDLLLIDEPEAHMHPHAVLAVAQALVALSQAGVTVLCATHSTEFLHQVSNCMLRTLADQPSEDGALPQIAADNLGVYRFGHDEDSGGTVINPVEVDPHWGIPEDEYVAVADHLAAQTERLVSHLQ